MAGYRDRLEADLERWIAEGLVDPVHRDAILADVGEPRRLDAATALAFVGLALLGLAVVAFVASNWDGLPRAFRFGLILLAFAGAVGGAVWASARRREATRNALLTLAAFIFAGAVGLTGQIFDIAGDPRASLYGAGLAAGLLALAGRSTGAAATALVLIGAGDLSDEIGTGWTWLLPAAAAAAGLAWSWRSALLAQAAAIALLVGAGRFALASGAPEQVGFALSLAFLLLAAGARWAAEREEGVVAATVYGWAVWGALGFFSASGSGEVMGGAPHRLALLALASAAVALGRHDRHGMITAGGVLAFFGAVSAVLFDLGLGLMSAAGLFAVCSVLALGAGWALRGRRQAA
ncbi:MAG: DUF2157 domain-containing protein [Proteobacteria bacterium]|nr:DUF2157 domain-containing protein [Pseudomonadota bacterium]